MQLSQRDQRAIERESKKAAGESSEIGDRGKKMGDKDEQFENFIKKMAQVQVANGQAARTNDLDVAINDVVHE